MYNGFTKRKHRFLVAEVAKQCAQGPVVYLDCPTADFTQYALESGVDNHRLVPYNNEVKHKGACAEIKRITGVPCVKGDITEYEGSKCAAIWLDLEVTTVDRKTVRRLAACLRPGGALFLTLNCARNPQTQSNIAHSQDMERCKTRTLRSKRC